MTTDSAPKVFLSGVLLVWPAEPTCSECGRLTRDARPEQPHPAIGAYCRCSLRALIGREP